MKIASRQSRPGRKTQRSEPVILFSISGQTFAINAGAIHEIRSTDSISAAAKEIPPAAGGKVRHVLVRGNQPLFVVSGYAHFGLPASRAEHVVILRNARIALLVNSIERMEVMSVLMALPFGFSGPERAWYRGITLMDGNVVPVVNPAGFLTNQELERLEATASQTIPKAAAALDNERTAPQEQRQ